MWQALYEQLKFFFNLYFLLVALSQFIPAFRTGASSPSDEEELSHSLFEGDFPPTCSVLSSSIRIGDLVLLEKNQRELASSAPTNWMARLIGSCALLVKLPFDHELLNLDAEIYGAHVQVPMIELLSAENMLWSNTVLAAGSAIGFVVYAGPEMCTVMNTSHPQTKVGLLDTKSVDSPSIFRAVCGARCIERVPWILVGHSIMVKIVQRNDWLED
ncbi:hypothetical protein F5888DRAFT_1889856 [Russula emetica]|nr:hypothetical protein F5888DRAFT_1889856 [Russula emetica]